MNFSNNHFDFSLHYLKKVKDISEKYNVSPDAVFDIECEIAGAASILQTDDVNYSQMDKFMETMKQSYSGPIPYTTLFYMIKGLLAHLKEKNVTKENVRDYMDKRILEFEGAVKSQSSTS